MCSPTPPAPPDPKETSAAQTGTSVATALANTSLGQVNQITPDGSLTYDQTGSYDFTDPYTNQTYTLPSFTATTSLSPEAQAIKDQNMVAQKGLADVAADRAGFLRDYLPNTEAATDAIDGKLYDLARKRIDPRFDRQRQDTQTRLAQQGVTMGSEAYNREMERVSQSENDANTQLMLQGRGQAASEVNMPINQITALLSGSQVSNPNVSMSQPSQIATTDNAGLINQNYGQRVQNWQTEQQNKQALMGGLFGLAAGGLSGGYF